MKPVAAHALLLGVAALMAASCSKSPEDVLREHNAAEKRPGFIRLVNLSTSPLKFKVLSPSGEADVNSLDASKFFIIISKGSPKVEIADATGNGTAAKDVAVTPNVAMSLIVTDQDPQGQFVSGEAYPFRKDDSSLRVVGATGTQTFTAVVKGPGGDATTNPVSLTAEAKEVPSGVYSIEIKDAGGKTVQKLDVDAKPKLSYTVAVALGKDGKLLAKTLLNNPPQVPTAAGVSN